MHGIHVCNVAPWRSFWRLIPFLLATWLLYARCGPESGTYILQLAVKQWPEAAAIAAPIATCSPYCFRSLGFIMKALYLLITCSVVFGVMLLFSKDMQCAICCQSSPGLCTVSLGYLQGGGREELPCQHTTHGLRSRNGNGHFFGECSAEGRATACTQRC